MARYADGIGTMVPGPSPRAVTNRIFNDSGQPLFSPRGHPVGTRVGAIPRSHVRAADGR
ncbi:hypothetical protein AB0F77_41965 [Streptomyces sp. NPDC026672]|uniref:hypothetical protein n=1 Tax=unclassified Streptomyces TaxID=2593676 RepID=UPI0033EC2401